MLTSRHFCTMFAALMLVSACERSAAPPSATVAVPASAVPAVAPTAAARPAVASVDAGLPNTAFALVAGSCNGKSCAAEIELVVNGQRLDVVPLEFAASDAKLVAKADDTSFASSQSLTTYTAGVTTYTAGEEEGAVTTAIQPVRLSAQRTGLLVQQAAGFEHVKRRRDVFVVEEKKLKRIWSKQDGSGPVRSYADVVASGTNADQIVLIEGGSFAPNQADEVTVQRLLWDEPGQNLQVLPVDSMAAMVVGNFANAEAARAKYAHPCLANYWVLRADQVGEKSKRFVLALLVPEAMVPALQARAKCLPKETQRKAQFRPINEKK